MPASEYYMIVTIQQQFVWCLLEVSTKFRGKYLEKAHTCAFTLKKLLRHDQLLHYNQVSKYGLNGVCTNLVCTVAFRIIYRVSSKTVCTPILLFSRVPEHIQKNFRPFFNSPGDEDFKTHLTFLPT